MGSRLRRRRAACLCLSLGLAGLPGFARIDPPSRPKPPRVEVVVTGSGDGQPIPEAEVSWSSASALPRRALRLRQPPEVLHTDLNGKCAIDLPSEGSFRVAVRREGYLDADDLSQFEHVEVVDVGWGKTVKLFVDLVRSGSFQGTVYLEDGRRLAGAFVRLQAASLSQTETIQGASPRWLTAKTDAQGNFGFPVVPPSRYGMWIAPPDRIVRESLQENDRQEWTGYATAIWHSSVEELRRIVPVEVTPGEEVRGYNAVLRKTKVCRFQGTLREWSGEPLLHAKVAIRLGTGEPINLLEPRSVSALTGDFDFPALPEGQYSLLVYRDDAPESPPYSIPLEAGATDVSPETRHVLRVPPWAPVAGKVAVVRPDPTVARKTPESPAGTQSQVILRRSVSWWEPAPVQVWLTPAENKTPARGDTVSLQSSETADWNSMSFPSMVLAPGAYQFQVQAPEQWYVASARGGDVDLLENRVLTLAERRYGNPVQIVVEIRQGGTALEGLLVNDKGEPLSGGAMCAWAEEPARRMQPGGAFCVRADSDGAFRSRWLSPGDWRVWALTRKPRENPASPAFQEKFERQARKLTVPENGVIGRRTLVSVE
jgi:hypothetical protein